MGNLYKKISELCVTAQITPGKLCREIGIQRSLISDLKAGRKQNLSANTLKKIADYFGVPVDYLLGDTSATSPAIVMGFGGPGQIILPDQKKSDKLQELIQLTETLSEEQLELLIQVARSIK